MKICFLYPHNWLLPLGEELEKLGHEISSDADRTTDVIMGLSITQIPKFIHAQKLAPQAKKVYYQWDIYDWVMKRPRKGEYDYKQYIQELKKCNEVWVPSGAEKARTLKYGIESIVIPTYSQYYEMPTHDGGYAYHILRQTPDDQDGWFEKACDEVGIPYKSSDRNRSWEEYKKVFGGARFIVSAYREASTGGLSLIEGYYNGIPALIDGQGWNAGKEYMGERATYFTGYEDLKEKLKEMYNNPPMIDLTEAKKWVEELYTPELMASRINDRLTAL